MHGDQAFTDFQAGQVYRNRVLHEMDLTRRAINEQRYQYAPVAFYDPPPQPVYYDAEPEIVYVPEPVYVTAECDHGHELDALYAAAQDVQRQLSVVQDGVSQREAEHAAETADLRGEIARLHQPAPTLPYEPGYMPGYDAVPEMETLPVTLPLPFQPEADDDPPTIPIRIIRDDLGGALRDALAAQREADARHAAGVSTLSADVFGRPAVIRRPGRRVRFRDLTGLHR
jgi:hypothetical protein